MHRPTTEVKYSGFYQLTRISKERGDPAKNPLMGFEYRREMRKADVTMRFEADGTTTDCIGY